VWVPLLWMNIGMRAASCASRFVAKSFASAFQPEWIDQILRIAANPLATQTKSRSFRAQRSQRHENGHRCAYVSSRYMRRIWQYVSNAAL
jgi:hypothetical protein